MSFSRFMKITLDMIGDVTRDRLEFSVYNDIFIKNINETVSAVEILNINTTIALETLFFNLKNAITKGQRGQYG
jgi:hypothetical protein